MGRTQGNSIQCGNSIRIPNSNSLEVQDFRDYAGSTQIPEFLARGSVWVRLGSPLGAVFSPAWGLLDCSWARWPLVWQPLHIRCRGSGACLNSSAPVESTMMSSVSGAGGISTGTEPGAKITCSACNICSSPP